MRLSGKPGRNEKRQTDSFVFRVETFRSRRRRCDIDPAPAKAG